ncbi:MAG: DUF2092 domain-containing protein [Planctomycetota bacterium]|jgi:hypothetical protein
MSDSATRTRPAILGLLATVVAIGAGTAWAGARDGGDAPDIDAAADRALRTMGEYMKARGEFSFHADVAYDSIVYTGQKLQFAGTADVTVRRPDRLRVEYRGDERSTGVFCDGSLITILDREKDLYAQAQAADDLDATMDRLFERYGFSVPIADFVYADPYAILTEYVETGTWVGLHTVEGTPCHHLAFTQETIDWQIWIEDGPRPVPRKLVVTYKDEPGSPQYTARLSRWDFQPKASDAWFVFAPPIGANEIEFLPFPEGVEQESPEMETGE